MPIQHETGDGADALYWNQVTDTLAGTYWSSGWGVSPGTNAMEVDVASGNGNVNGSSTSSGSTQVLTLNAADGTYPRKDTIWVDGTGTAQVTTGTAAEALPTGEVRDNTFQPEPPIPGSNGVMVAEVWVPAGASDITSSDIIDRRMGNGAVASAGGVSFIQTSKPSYSEGSTWLDPQTDTLHAGYDDGISADYHKVGVDPIWGDGSDGNISRSSDGNENGLIHADRYEVQSGVTRTVSNGVLAIFARDEIVIDGTIDASGQGGSYGSGGAGGVDDTDPGDNGGSGQNGDLKASNGSGGTGGDGSSNTAGGNGGAGAGGGGGYGYNTNGGDGGNSGQQNLTNAEVDALSNALSSPGYDTIYDLSCLAGSGGGGGGGGGGGLNDSDGADGANGGNGGGVVLLAAPSVTVNGTITADASGGNDGVTPNNTYGGGGGGGGGGAGGSIIFIASNINDSSTISASGGLGGSGGRNAGDGGDGSNGNIVVIEA